MSEKGKVIALPRGKSIDEFMAEVLKESETFGARSAFVMFFNRDMESVMMQHDLTQSQGGLILADLIRLLAESRHFETKDVYDE